MKKILGLLLVAAMLTTSVCAMAETFEGVGKGMGGDVKLAVTVEPDADAVLAQKRQIARLSDYAAACRDDDSHFL